MQEIQKMLRTIEKGFQGSQKRLDNVEATNAEMKDALRDYGKHVRALSRAQMDGYIEPDHPGVFWPTEEQAKEFNELILKALGRREKTLDETGIGGGSVLVGGDLKDWLIQKLGIYGRFRANAMVFPIGQNSGQLPKVSADLTVYCPGEGGAITQSDMGFQQVTITARKWACLAAVTNELIEDSLVGIGQIVGMSATRSMAKQEDLVGFVGDGTSTYFGMTGIAGALRAVDAIIGNIAGLKVASGNAYSEITLADFDGVVALLPEEAENSAKWYMSKTFYYTVVWPLARTAGVANIFEILSDRKSKYFMGFEVVFTSAMPTAEANSQICAILGYLQLGAYLGERRELTIEESKDVYFASDLLGVRATERLGITVHGVGDTSEAGPIVGLITAAS